LCGLAGIKPTYGLCSRAGVLPLAHSLDTAGPLAWTVQDCALLLANMVGHDPEDPTCNSRAVPDVLDGLEGGVKGLRVGVIRHFHEGDILASRAVRAGVDHLADVMRAEGASVQEVVLPPLQEFHAAGWIILMSEAHSVHEPWLRSRFGDYGEFLRARLALAALVSAADYLRAQRRRREFCVAMAAAMQDCDLLLTAAQSAEAAPIELAAKFAGIKAPSLTMPFNLTGQPALTVCTGFGEGGLPVGAQIVGRPFQDGLVLRAGHAFERATSWRQRRPSLA
jgi:aspartyl-tRNA(Asn)/glutamyl-tRNA(Gln) amidotransferase subunit A